MSELHRFFFPGQMEPKSIVSLGSETSKHIWQVLRMGEGDQIELTDGKGALATGEIQFAERHKCNVKLAEVTFTPRIGGKLHLCVAFTRNNGRNEWLLEKATELGVASITPVSSDRFNKTHIRHDRWEKILQSAILQSQQSYLPELSQLSSLKETMELYKDVPQKFIAHCIDDSNKQSLAEMLKPGTDTVLLIGPEGDFTKDEVNLCLEHGYRAVSLGHQRLRTETAAITVAAYFNLIS